MKLKTIHIPIDDVDNRDLSPRDPGDVQELADSIATVGLIHAVVVNSDNRLLAGNRRLLACRQLGWPSIRATVIDAPRDLVSWFENTSRKDLDDFEKVRIIESLRSQARPIKPQQHQIDNRSTKTGLRLSDTKQREHENGTRSKSGRFAKRLTTTADAAAMVGMTRQDYFRTAKLLRDGVPELVEFIRGGKITKDAAYLIAAQPAARQRAILALPPDERRAAVSDLRQGPAVEVKRRAKSTVTLKQLKRQMLRWSEHLAAAPSDSAESEALISLMKENIAVLEAKKDAYPDPKPRRRRRKPTEPEQPRERPPVISDEDLDLRWVMLSEAQREQAEQKAAAVEAAVFAHRCDKVSLKEAFSSVAAGVKWSARSLSRWYYKDPGLVDYHRHLWAMAMAPGHLGGSATAECHPAAWRVFLADYLRPEQPPLTMCYRNLLRLAKSEGWTIPRSAAALKRRLDREMPPEAVILARQGSEALARRRPAQVRDRSSLRALEAVNADGHRMDVFVRWPDGTVTRPTLTAWQDIYSGKLLSWRIDRTENTDGYRLSFADLLRTCGIPKHVIVDNGRGIASKQLTGGTANRYRFRIKRDEPLGLLTQLVGSEGIHWTTPYHGQSKPIERAFRDLATDIAKDYRLRGAYTGNKPDAKPDNYRSKAIPLKQFLEVLADGIRQHNARRGRRGLGLDGRSFDEAFQASYEKHVADIPKPTTAQLDRWLLGAVGITAHKSTGAVELFKTRYWSERLAEKLAGRSAEARKVVVRFDPDHLDRPVTVETLDGKLIARAEAQDAVRFLDTQAARATARDQGRLKKNAREQLDIHKSMAARDMAALLDAAGAETQEAETPPARSKVVGGAFGLPPAKSDSKAAEAEQMVHVGEGLVLKIAEQVMPKRSEEEDGGRESAAFREAFK